MTYYTIAFRLPEGMSTEEAAERISVAKVEALAGIGRPGYIALDFDCDLISPTLSIINGLVLAQQALPGATLARVEYDEVNE